MTRLEIARKSLAFDAQQPKVRRLEARLEARQARVAKANEREQRAKEYAIAVARREANGMSRQAAHVEAMARVPKNYEAWKGADCPPIQGARGAKGYVTRVAELQVEGFSQSEARARARSENPKGFRAHEASLSTA